ncbi:MAG: tetratricopeptide repeat protein, partial [Casimicrobiaceae bacterium]
DAGHYREAALELARALALDPRDAATWLTLAQVHIQLNDPGTAQTEINNAISINPLDVEINVDSSSLLLSLDDPPAAASCARRATTLDPPNVSAWFNLALALQADGQAGAARNAATRALELDPANAAAAGVAAELAAECGDLADARATLAEGLRRHPRHVALLMEEGWLASRSGELAGASDAYSRVLAIEPRNGAALSQLLYCRKQMLDWRDLAALQRQFLQGVAEQTPLLTPFSLLSDPSSRAQQRQCAQTWAQGFVDGAAQPSALVAAASPATNVAMQRRLRIGYLSGDFYDHPTAVLLAGVLEHHDRSRFEVFAYSTGPFDASAMRTRIAAACEHFVDIRARQPQRVAARIAQDRLDVLVDLKGYTEGAATRALALRPAPVQVHWIGYPGTLASPFIDYLVADKTVVPESHQPDYAEALAWLPHCYQPNDRSRSASGTPSRESLGLDADSVVFAGFNAPWKFNAPVFDAWAQVLAATPRSQLWLLARGDDDPVIANVIRELGSRGVARPRIVFANRRAQAGYLALYGHADVFLDTWPYNAHTTASDALWMGCPVVTWLGETFAGRVGASLVHAADVAELVATDVDGYVALAVALAADPPRRARLRDRLMRARGESPLFDAKTTARHMESAFETMVEQRRDGRRESFEVAAIA